MTPPTRLWCDECEAEIPPAYEGAHEPAHVTGGDHYWCDACWRDRPARCERCADMHPASELRDGVCSGCAEADSVE